MLELLKNGVIILLTVALLFSQAWAIDLTAMSNDELHKLAGAIKNAPQKEQESYQKEWQLRLSKMTEDELKRYRAAAEINNGNRADEPIYQGRGYDKQGAGMVIFGGMPPAK